MIKRASLLSVVLVASGAILPSPAQQQPAIARTHLKMGDAAPDFTLPDQTRKLVKLSDYRGKKNVILAFYVLAFTGG